MENRHNKPLPSVKALIRIKHREGVFLCRWEPYNPDDYENTNQPAEGFLGTAIVLHGEEHAGIGFHAWEQNDAEFVEYTFIDFAEEVEPIEKKRYFQMLNGKVEPKEGERYFQVLRVDKDWSNYVKELDIFVGQIGELTEEGEDYYRLGFHGTYYSFLKEWCVEVDKNGIQLKTITVPSNDLDFIVDSLNAYWNDAHAQLSDTRKGLGDIERKNLEYQKAKSKELMNKLEKL